MITLLPDGLEMSHDEAGSGIPLLFIHGWPHNRTLWAAQMGGLIDHARCIAPDLRGFGGTSVKPPFTIDQYADDLVRLLDTLGIAQAVACGVSMGGYIAFSMLRRHPTRLRALILTSTRATADTPEGREKRARLIGFVRDRGVEALAAKQLKAMVGATTFDTRPHTLEALRAMMAAAPVEGVTGALQAMADRADSTDLLAGIPCPVLVVSGAEDTFTPPEELRALAAAIPRSRLEVIESAGHVCPYERPAAFNHVAGEFLASLLYD